MMVNTGNGDNLLKNLMTSDGDRIAPEDFAQQPSTKRVVGVAR
jgi:hypothetical protein